MQDRLLLLIRKASGYKMEKETYHKLREALETKPETFPEMLSMALKEGFPVDYRPSTRSNTLLYLAVLNSGARTNAGHDAVRALLKAGADVNVCDYWGRSVLSRCIIWNMPSDIIEKILDRTNDINALDRIGKTVFGVACQVFVATYKCDSPQNESRLRIIKRLLAHGADPDKDISWKILNARGNEYASENDRLALKELVQCYMTSKDIVVAAGQ